MFLKFFIGSLILTNISFANELFVQDGLKNYKLNYSEHAIKLEGGNIDLSLIEKKCNKRLIKRFSAEVQRAFKKMPKKKMTEPGNLEIIKEKQTYYVSPGIPSGLFFRNLPEEVKRLKLQESFSCKTK